MSRKTVLVVDDEPGIVQLVASVLESRGYVVLVAPDGFAAIRAANLHAGPIDLLLTDVRMPGLQGPKLCEQLNQKRPDIYCLLMTGCPEVISGLGVKFISKPFHIPDLLRRISAVLGPGSDIAGGTTFGD